MKGYNAWSYRPYRPFLIDVGDIYVCRVVPYENAIRFEWLPGEDEYDVFYRKRGEGDFILWEKTKNSESLICGLNADEEYEFYVSSNEKKSRVRLARCGASVGTTVNYLHPDDEAYSFSGRYLCSPSLVRHPDGYLLASMDLFAGNHPQNLTMIFRSDDDGESWHYVSELMPCFWGKLFIHKGVLYMAACSTEYGDLLIASSTDGGKSFSAPTTLLRGGGGKNGSCGVHKNPQNVIYYGGRLYITLEWGSWKNKDYCHAAMIASIEEDADLLAAENWSFSEPKRFNPNDAPELSDLPNATMTIEGTPVIAPDGKLYDVMRFGKFGKALVYAVNTEDHDAPLEYSHCIDFPANYSKFVIKKDEKSGYYYSIGTMAYNPERTNTRNLLSLLRSRDLKTLNT